MSEAADVTKANVEVANANHHKGGDKLQFETIDRMRCMGFNLGNAYRYITRLGLKGGDNTVQRDAGAAMWYCLDLVSWFCDYEDGSFEPKVDFFSAFNAETYYHELWRYAEVQEKTGGLYFARSDPRKRTVLAALDRVIRRERDFVEAGASDAAYYEHVQDMFIAAAITIQYAYTQSEYASHCANSCEPSSGKKTKTRPQLRYESFARNVIPCPMVSTIYKGSRSFQPGDNTFDLIETMITMLDRLGLRTYPMSASWGLFVDGDDDDIDQ